MADEFCAGDEGLGAAPGFGGCLEVLEGPSGRRRWSDALKGRIVAESFAPGARVCDVARRYRVTGQQLTTWRRAAREGLLALPGEAVDADDLGLVSVEVEAPVEASEESVTVERGKRDEAQPTAGREDWIEIVAGRVLVRLPASTAVSRVAAIVMATRPVDFRRGHDGLAATVQKELGLDPHSGLTVVFRSRRGDRLKIPVWDGTGLVLTYKRLEAGKFVWPQVRDGVMRLSPAQFEALFEGLDWRRVTARRVREPAAAN